MDNDEVIAALKRGSDEFATIRKVLTDISERLEPLPQMQEDIAATKELVELWDNAKVALRFAQRIGTIIKWVGGVAVALASVLALIKIWTGRLF